MSLTRRRLFTGMFETPRGNEWISARGREAMMAGHADAQVGASGSKFVRISSNENPLGPGQHVVDAIVGKFPEAARYPFNATQKEGALIGALAQKFGARPEQIVLGPGSGDILTHAVRAFTSPTRPLVTAWPSFEAPREAAKKIGSAVREVGFDSKLRIDLAKLVEASKGAGLVFFCNPNNPTSTVPGTAAVADTVKAIRTASPDTAILNDEAYHDYVTDPSYESAIPLALSTPNVFVTRTFSKAYGMAGLRAGYAIGDQTAIKAITAYKMPYALGNQRHIDTERTRNAEVKAFTVKAFADMGFTGADSQANFVFMDIKRPAAGFRDGCRAAGVFVGRDFPFFEKTHCRISIGTMEEMQRAIVVFKSVLGGATSTSRQQARR